MRISRFLGLLICSGLLLIQAGAFAANQSAAESTQPLPEGWRSGYVVEPVFDSRMFWVEAGANHTQTLVLIHGLGQNGWRDWQDLMPELAQHYRVIAFDLPGFGRSEVPAGKYSPSNYAAAVYQALKHSGITRFNLMGHSMGGAVALRLATRYPEAVDHLVLMSAAGILERSAFAQHSTALPLEAGMLSYFNALPKSVQGSVSNWVREVGGELLRWDALPDPTALLSKSDTAWGATLQGQPNMNAALALVGENFTGDLTSLGVPTLILWGADDPVAPVRTGHLLAGQIPAAKLVVYPSMGHMPLWHPSKVLPPIHSFFSGELNVAKKQEVEGKPHGDYLCSRESDITLTGSYRHIDISDCQRITLVDVTARSLKVTSSSVVGRGLTLQGGAWALKADHADIELTNAHIEADLALSANASQLDFAGVTLIGKKEAVRAYQQSEFTFSVSQLQANGRTQNLHGVFSLGEPVGE